MHIRSVREARPVLRELWQRGETIGSIHTLGALHTGHAKLIELSAHENKHTVVTIYPNKIQLFPGSRYVYDLEQDVALSYANGATIVISSDDAEMYSSEYCTYIDQLERHRQLNSSVFSFATRGQVTGAIRWICLTRPTRSYFGMKDIEQALMVERAVEDLLIDCEIRHIPCIRFRNGVSISSRLLGLPRERLEEVGNTYRALEEGRKLIVDGEKNSSVIASHMKALLDSRLTSFRVIYVTVVDARTFMPIENIQMPFILHCAITDGKINHFDGLCIRNSLELANSPDVIWLD